MNILFVAPYVPSRIRVRPFHFALELCKRHKVYIAALGELGGAKSEGFDDLARAAQEVKIVPHSRLRGFSQSLLALPSPYPMCTSFCRSPAMKTYDR